MGEYFEMSLAAPRRRANWRTKSLSHLWAILARFGGHGRAAVRHVSSVETALGKPDAGLRRKSASDRMF